MVESRPIDRPDKGHPWRQRYDQLPDRLDGGSHLLMALEYPIPGRHGILTTAMTTASLSSGQARVDSDTAHDKIDRTGSVSWAFLFLSRLARLRGILT